jgi:hypothetical protein
VTHRVGRITRVLRWSTYRSHPWLSRARRSVRLRRPIDPVRPRDKRTISPPTTTQRKQNKTKNRQFFSPLKFPPERKRKEKEKAGWDGDDDDETHGCPAHVSRSGHFDRTVKAPLSIFGLGFGYYSGMTRRVYGRVARYVDLGSARPGCWRARVVRDAQREGDDPHHVAQCRIDETCC